MFSVFRVFMYARSWNDTRQNKELIAKSIFFSILMFYGLFVFSFKCIRVKQCYLNLKDGKHLSYLFYFISFILSMLPMESLAILIENL